jgi:hypothetical protein
MNDASDTVAPDKSASAPTRAEAARPEPVPLVIGVTGHRDLVASEIPELEKRVRGFLITMQGRFGHLPLQIMTPLSEGADRLVARVARELGIPLIVPLPMPRALYMEDFRTDASRREFESLCEGAEVYELGVVDGQSIESILEPGHARNLQYAQMGVYICSHCHILLALWDGKPAQMIGGTANVIQFHQWDIMPGFTGDNTRMRQILADDESDLVYHIVCSRDRPDGEPAESFRPLQALWFTTDAENPRTEELPPQYVEIFRRTSQFNEDAVKYESQIETGSWPLLPKDAPEDLKKAVSKIDRMFRISDYLAIHYQTRVTLALRIIYSLAVLMGIAFIAYTDIPGGDFMVYAFLGLFGIGFVIYKLADRGAWHRKYLDYRALAEGLRVQFYWAAAGVKGERHSKYAHDNFLQKQDVELGWIRNVMRVAGHGGVDRMSGPPATGLDFAIQEWVGGEPDGPEGQLGYYVRKIDERIRHSKLTETIGTACLWAGIGVTAALAIAGNRLNESWSSALIVLMGILPLIAAVREAYAQKRAEKELIKQYVFMSRIFKNARRKLNEAANDNQRLQILRALGNAALDEHAEWILIHRERPLEAGSL